MIQGNLNYSNEVGWISFLQYLVDGDTLHLQLNIGFFEYKFCLNKKELTLILDELEDWLNTKPKNRIDDFEGQGFILKETTAPLIQSLTRIRIKHPKRGLDFSRNDLFHLTLDNHPDIFLTQSDIRNIISIVKCV